MRTGWLEDEGKWYYFNKTETDGELTDRDKEPGAMLTGWKEIDGKHYSFNADGSMYIGMLQHGNKIYFWDTDGTPHTGILEYQGKKYYFDDNGTAHTDWLPVGNKKYFFDSDGTAHTGILKYQGKTYYFDADGTMHTGWLTIDNKVYFFDPDGTMHTGRLITDDGDYIFNVKGVLQTKLLYPENYSLDEAGIDFIKEHEGLSLYAYLASANEEYYTIGYGHCGPDVTYGMVISEEDAVEYLKNDIVIYERIVKNQTAGLKMTQSQYNALVSLCYNTGGGDSIISGSPLARYLSGELSESEAGEKYSRYYASSYGTFLKGLVNRRNDEADMFFN